MKKPLFITLFTLGLLITLSISITYYHLLSSSNTGYTFSEIVGGILNNRDIPVEDFVSLIDSIENEDRKEYSNLINALDNSTSPTSLENLYIQGKRDDTAPYKGIFLNDIRDARQVLANVENVKIAGIDTLLLNITYAADPDTGNLYIPAENVYRFYINAFNKSGFRLWIAMSTTHYDFPYGAWSNNEELGIEPLENQEDLLEMVEPFICKWSEISESFNIDTFIPAEEGNSLLIDKSYTETNLCQEDRRLMNKWMQEILPEIESRFTGKVGFASNDNGNCETQEDPNALGGPDFDYTGYNFAILKIPFRSVFEKDSEWDYFAQNTLADSTRFIDRDSLDGLILYETGDTVGTALEEDFAGSLPVRNSDEQHQYESYIKDMELLEMYEDEVIGLFFKVSYIQPHEPSWNPFDNPAEAVLQEYFGSENTLPITELDKVWTEIGEDGLKIIQVCLSDEMPFDPEYLLDYTLTEDGEYHQLVENVRQVCSN